MFRNKYSNHITNSEYHLHRPSPDKLFLESPENIIIYSKTYNNNSFCQVQNDLGNELIYFKTFLTCCDKLTANHIIGNNSN